VELNEELILYK